MKIIPQNEYSNYIHIADSISICRVYPMSVAEGIQSGHIYTGGDAVLFRHQNNFTFIAGTPDADFIDAIHDLIVNDGMKLICTDKTLCDILISRGGTAAIPRCNYVYPNTIAPKATLPDGYSFRNIDKNIFESVSGRVAPSLFWSSADQFLKNGMGVCVMFGSEVASWAFSSAVSRDECDIGIQTADAHRKKGLAKAAAAQLIGNILPNKRPTWSCQISNKGSAHTAESLGFKKCCEVVMIKAANN